MCTYMFTGMPVYACLPPYLFTTRAQSIHHTSLQYAHIPYTIPVYITRTFHTPHLFRIHAQSMHHTSLQYAHNPYTIPVHNTRTIHTPYQFFNTCTFHRTRHLIGFLILIHVGSQYRCLLSLLSLQQTLTFT